MKATLLLTILTLLISTGYAQQKKSVLHTPITDVSQSTKSGHGVVNQSILSANDSVYWVVPSTGYASRAAKAPSNRYNYQRGEYLIKKAEILSSGFASGSLIGSIGFMNICGGIGSLEGVFHLFIKNTTDTVYSLGNTWNTDGFTQVFSEINYIVDVDQCVYRINLDPVSQLTYTGGSIYIAWEFSSPESTTSSIHVFHACNVTSESLQYGATSNTSLPVNLTASTSRPATFLSPTQDWTDLVRVTNIHTLEKLPIPFAAAQPVGVRVDNISPSVLNFNLSLTVTDSATSSIIYTDTQPVYLPGDSAMIFYFTGWYPYDTRSMLYTASTTVIAGESFVINNSCTIPVVSNDHVFSYNDNFTARMSWGITYPDDGIFAVRYQMGSRGLIDGAYFRISYLTAAVGNKIKAVVLDSSGTIVGESPDYIIEAGDLDQRKFLGLSVPVPFENEPFYVGLYLYAGTQQWYGMTAGFESPLRSETMYEFPPEGGQGYEYTADESNSKWLIDASVTPLVAIGCNPEKEALPKFYPNPSSNTIFLDFPINSALGIVYVQICGLMGETLISYECNDQIKQKIPLEGLASGVYIIRITKGAHSSVAKLLKI